MASPHGIIKVALFNTLKEYVGIVTFLPDSLPRKGDTVEFDGKRCTVRDVVFAPMETPEHPNTSQLHVMHLIIDIPIDDEPFSSTVDKDSYYAILNDIL